VAKTLAKRGGEAIVLPGDTQMPIGQYDRCCECARAYAMLFFLGRHLELQMLGCLALTAGPR
jgi:hypothetical protein